MLWCSAGFSLALVRLGLGQGGVGPQLLQVLHRVLQHAGHHLPLQLLGLLEHAEGRHPQVHLHALLLRRVAWGGGGERGGAAVRAGAGTRSDTCTRVCLSHV